MGHERRIEADAPAAGRPQTADPAGGQGGFADPAKADKRTRSKWSRVMRYAGIYKLDSEPLDQFIRRKGGINACAARFSRCLGRIV
jgi:hypothetical protein